MTGSNEPGASLAIAREEAGLSVDHVAAQMHISPRRIIALEENDYDELPEPPYVRGYLRNYAQLVKIDPEPLVEAYNSYLQELNKVELNSTIPPTAAITVANNEKIIRYASIAVVVVVAGLLIIWWQSRESDATKPDFETAKTSEFEVDSEAESIGSSAEENELTTITFGDQAKQQQDQADKKAAASAASVNEFLTNKEGKQVSPRGTVEDVKQISAAETGRRQVTKTERRTVQQKIAEPDQQSAVVKKKASSPVDKTGGKQEQIVLYVQEDSWVDIRDSQDSKLIYKTVNAGQIITLSGQGPFKVFLGNAGGVKLFYNGQEQDVSRFQRGLIARFRLGTR